MVCYDLTHLMMELAMSSSTSVVVSHQILFTIKKEFDNVKLICEHVLKCMCEKQNS